MPSFMSGLFSLIASVFTFLKGLQNTSASESSSSASSPGSSTSLNWREAIRTSRDGISLIKNYEGVSLKAYRDIVGVLTIGYGDTSNVKDGMTITMEEAESRLKNRLAIDFEPSVCEALASAPTQKQFDAMVSLSYNIGASAFAKSTLVRKFNAGDVSGAADEFVRWDKAGGKSVKGLRRRRASERALFLGSSIADALSIGSMTE